MESFFDMPAGYSDADLEMSDLEDRGRRRERRIKAFRGDELERLEAGETVTCERRNPETGTPYQVLARVVDEDEAGSIFDYSIDGANWYHSGSLVGSWG